MKGAAGGSAPRILVAGIGNVFLGDDGFGVEVVRRLATAPLPPGVRAADFGIRGLHLAFELLEPPDLLVLVDAMPRGEPPGTLTLLEPDLAGLEATRPDAHGLDVLAVLAQVRAMGGTLPRLRVVGCEPARLDDHLGLSPAVEAAIEPAMALVHRVIDDERASPALEAR